MQRLKSILITTMLLASLNNVATAASNQEQQLKDKIAQMLIIGFNGMEVKPDDAITKAIVGKQIGGVILFDYDYPRKTFEHNIKNPAQLKNLTAQLQDYAHNGFPLFIAIDYEGGKVNRLKESYGFPRTIPAAEFAKLSDADAAQMANQMAQTLKDAGINLNFAPVIDVNVNAESPAIGKLGRSFSAQPEVVAKYAKIYAQAFRAHGILCSYKHFPGHGSATGDTHEGFVDVTETWKDYELHPYQTLLSDPTNCDMIMTAHVKHYGLENKGYPATLSKSILTGLLRETLQFKGVIVTDDMQMKAISDVYGLHEAVRMTINAGSDILIFGNQLAPTPQDASEFIDMIYQDVKSGQISEARINEAYNRIIKLKKQLMN
jgi:beta-N-acetylhexosaminidase